LRSRSTILRHLARGRKQTDAGEGQHHLAPAPHFASFDRRDKRHGHEERDGVRDHLPREPTHFNESMRMRAVIDAHA
jgi:hypothetical protein